MPLESVNRCSRRIPLTSQRTCAAFFLEQTERIILGIWCFFTRTNSHNYRAARASRSKKDRVVTVEARSAELKTSMQTGSILRTHKLKQASSSIYSVHHDCVRLDTSSYVISTVWNALCAGHSPCIREKQTAKQNKILTESQLVNDIIIIEVTSCTYFSVFFLRFTRSLSHSLTHSLTPSLSLTAPSLFSAFCCSLANFSFSFSAWSVIQLVGPQGGTRQ